jgi:hypothetical protein
MRILANILRASCLYACATTLILKHYLQILLFIIHVAKVLNCVSLLKHPYAS